jgi:hypothetical protein
MVCAVSSVRWDFMYWLRAVIALYGKERQPREYNAVITQ